MTPVRHGISPTICNRETHVTMGGASGAVGVASRGSTSGGERHPEARSSDQPGTTVSRAEVSEDSKEEALDGKGTAATPIKIAKDPGAPTAQERDEHFVAHLPYRSWCHVCVKARVREDDHKRISDDDKSDKPTVGLDYKSFGQADDSDDKITQIVMRDERSRMTFAHTCDAKGSTDQWIVSKLLEDLDSLGHVETILKWPEHVTPCIDRSSFCVLIHSCTVGFLIQVKAEVWYPW